MRSLASVLALAAACSGTPRSHVPPTSVGTDIALAPDEERSLLEVDEDLYAAMLGMQANGSSGPSYREIYFKEGGTAQTGMFGGTAYGGYGYGEAYTNARVTIASLVQQIPNLPPPTSANQRCDVGELPRLDCDAGTQMTTSLDGCLEELLSTSSLARVEGDSLQLTAAGLRAAVESSRSTDPLVILLDSNLPVARLVAASVVAFARSAALDETQRARVGRNCAQTLQWLDTHESVGAPALTCLVRGAAGLAQAQLAKSWGGCACGARGRQLGTTCFESTSKTRLFHEQPIDTRMPLMLAAAVERANATLAPDGIAIRAVGLTGCNFPRLERGTTMRTLDAAPHPRFSASLVSNHTAASACDLSRVWIADRMVSVLEMYWALLDPTGNEAFASEHALRKRQRADVKASGGEGRWFRNVTRPRTAALARTHAIAVALRNALVDVGLVVFTPVTNSVHKDHFHFALPVDGVATELANSSTPSETREQLIANDLARAAGVSP